jgi:hypothetical protein
LEQREKEEGKETILLREKIKHNFNRRFNGKQRK